MKKLILSCIVLFSFTQGMYGQINSSLFDQIETESSEVELLPPSMIFTQRLLWGEKRRPKNIPSKPYITFKNNGWIDWSDYLGVEIKDYGEKTVPFEKAREYARSLKFRTTKEWKEFCKSNKKPSYITSNPARVYKNRGWINMEDWLGVSLKTFDEAKKFVHSLNLKSQREWRLYKEKLPVNIPSNPHTVYEEFVDYNDWLNVSNVKAGSIKYLSLNEAKKFVSKLGLKGTKEWDKYCKSGKKPENIPSSPSYIYKDKGFISMSNFLGYSSNRGKNRNTLTYEEAQKICVKLKVLSANDYRNKKKQEILPSNIPSAPDRVFKNKGWISWGEFLGTGRKSSGGYLTFKESRIIVQKLNLRSQREWNIYSKVSRPSNIPSNPQNTYKINWNGWDDFLGKEKLSFISFNEARSLVRKLKIKTTAEWKTYSKSKRPLNIPSNPQRIYIKEWKGWADFLGKED